MQFYLNRIKYYSACIWRD